MEELDRTANVDVMYVAEMDPPTAVKIRTLVNGRTIVSASLNFKSFLTVQTWYEYYQSTKQVFKSTRASVPKEGDMAIFTKELKINNTFEVIFDNGTDQSSSKEEGDSLHNKVQA